MEGREAGVAEGEEVGRRRRWMGLMMRGEEAAGEAPLELRRGPVEGVAGGSRGWAGEAAGRTCPVGMEAEEEAQRWELWRGEAAAGRLGPGQGEGEVGLSCGVGVGEEGHRPWMEGVEELASVAHF